MNNEQVIWNYLKSKGLNDFGIAGLMGNLKAESNLNSKNLQQVYEKSLGMTDDSYTKAVDNGTYTNFVNDKAGYGLAQWTWWSRKENLLKFANKRKASIGDLDMQLDFLYEELTKSYPQVWKDLMNATSVLEASNSVLLKFERPANQSESVQKKRAGYGQEYYDKYKTNTVDKQAENKKYYRVQAGAFKYYEKAEAMRKEIIAKGFPCILKDIDGYYKCQIGAYSVKANAQSMLKKIQAAGYKDAYITYC